MNKKMIQELNTIKQYVKNSLVIVLNFKMFGKNSGETCRCFLPIKYKNLFESGDISKYFINTIYSRPYFIPRVGKNFDLEYEGNKNLICQHKFNPSTMTKLNLQILQKRGEKLPICFAVEMPRDLFNLIFTNKANIIYIDGDWIEKYITRTNTFMYGGN